MEVTDECYIVAVVSGRYMYRSSKPYTSRAGAIKEYQRQVKEGKDSNLKILKANWRDVDFEYK